MIRLGIFLLVLSYILFVIFDHQQTRLDIAQGRGSDAESLPPVTKLDYFFYVGFRGIATAGIIGVFALCGGIIALTGLSAF